MFSTQPIAYTYNAEQWTPAGLIEVGIREGWLAPAARDMSAEDVLDQAQHSFGIDRYDESTYDSDEFPKAIFECDDDDVFRNEDGAYVKLG